VGRISEVTVLFADARGFTALIHEHGPEEITPYIDEFFRRCSKIVIDHDGIIDHFRGDAVLAFFNVPIRREDHLNQAIEAAREIQMAVPNINKDRGGSDLLKVGVGITTGMGLATTVGSNACTDYTIMGDVANIASRLQGLAEPGEILISDEVYEAVQSGYPDAEKRVVDLKGISSPVQVYSLATGTSREASSD